MSTQPVKTLLSDPVTVGDAWDADDRENASPPFTASRPDWLGPG
jgi:hypothetical protein